MSKASSLKWGKKEKESRLKELKEVLLEGEALAFVSTKPTQWTVLVFKDSEFKDISHQVAGITDRFVVDTFLKELKYDSPEVITNELKGVMGYTTPFKLQVF